jgi:hypothetical protein
MASTPQMAATTPPLSSCAPIPPDPAVLERGPIGIDGPAAHLHARVHVPVEHEAAAAAARALWFTTLKARAFIFR